MCSRHPNFWEMGKPPSNILGVEKNIDSLLCYKNPNGTFAMS